MNNQDKWITAGAVLCVMGLAMVLVVKTEPHSRETIMRLFIINIVVLLSGFACFVKSISHIFKNKK